MNSSYSPTRSHPTSRRLLRTALLALAVSAPSVFSSQLAFAQTYVVTTRSEPYVNLDNIAGIGPIDQIFSNFSTTLDRNNAIGFDFPYAGATYTEFACSVEGWIGLGGDVGTTSSEPTNVGTNTNTTYGPVIAAFWTNLSSNTARTGITGTAPNRARVIEWDTWYSGSGGTTTDAGRMQVWLMENGSIEFRYSGTITTGYAATMGVTGPAGSPQAALLPCGETGTCTNAEFTSAIGTVYKLQISEPELGGHFGAFPRGLLPGTSGTGEIILDNFGINTATTVASNVWLSTDQTLDAGDWLLGSVVSDMPSGNTNVTVDLTVDAAIGPGDYFVLLEVDAPDAWAEPIETNNLVLSPEQFATVYELQPIEVEVTNPGGVNPGQTVNFALTIQNNGALRVGPVDVNLYVSNDAVFSPGQDLFLGTATANLQGTSNVEVVMVSAPLVQIPPGDYYAVAELDPNDVLVESDETNNSFVGSNVFTSGPDLAVGSVVIPAAVSPGSPVQISTTIDSISVPYSGDVTYRLWASTDDMLDLAVDTTLDTITVAMNGEVSLPDVRNVVFPASLPAGRYHVIATVDPTNQIVEVSETNNTGVSATLLSNAPDFAASNVSISPASVEVGATMTLSATAESIGLPFTGNVPYAVVLSADDVFDPGDQRVHEGNVFIPGQTTASIDTTFPLQALAGDPQLTPGTFKTFVVIDPDNTVEEAAETNNAGPGGDVSILGAELRVTSFTAPSVAFIGRPYQISLTLTNEGVADADNFQYAYYLSDNPIIRVTDDQIFVSQMATIASGGAQTFVDTVTLPDFAEEQTLYLGVIVDIFSQVPETNEPNNVARMPTPGGQSPIQIVFPIPDLTAEIVSTATAAAAGEQLAVTRVVANTGVAPASGVEYTYYLSSNPVISADDIPLETFTVDLPLGADDYGIDLMQVPSGVAEGTYYIGLLIDPTGAISEVDEDNNAALGPSLAVYGAAIQFTTQSLPPATLGTSYEVSVHASGGPLPITWAVQAGALPPGLTLDSDSGIIAGTPTEEGLFELTLRALSGTAYADQRFSIRVSAATTQLQVATAALPSAIAGRSYGVGLVAVGGQVPYEWSSISDLPDGLTLAASGELSGTPTAPIASAITFVVRDAVGQTTTKELVLRVISGDQSIQIVPIALPTAVVGLPYCDQSDIRLEVANGVAPYRWSIVGEPPAGMTLGEDGSFCGTPGEVGRFPVTVRVQDQTGLFDTSVVLFEVADGTSLTISSFSLAPAVVGGEYEETLSAMRGTEPYTWSIIEQAGALPPGLSIQEDGRIAGTPTEAGTFAFLVQVVDAAGQTKVQPLWIEVDEAPVPPPADEGCGCSASRPDDGSSGLGLAAFLGLGGLLALRRRRGVLLGGAVLALSLMVGGAASAQTTYVVTTQSAPYVQLDSIPGIGTIDEIFSNFSTTLDRNNAIGFDFEYNGVTYTEFACSVEGWIGLGGDVGTTSSEPNNVGTTTNTTFGPVLAAFWTNLASNDARTGLVGTAPDRVRVIEWDSWQASSGGSSSDMGRMQVWLFESGSIEFHYFGNITTGYAATMGVTGEIGSPQVALLPCGETGTCSGSDFVGAVGTVFRLEPDRGPELVAEAITAPEIAFLGAETNVDVQVWNRHANAIGPFTVAVVAADNALLSGAVTIGSFDITLPGFLRQTISIAATPPTSFGEGPVWFGAVVDSGSVITEFDEDNNTVVSEAPVRLLLGAPDIAVEHVRASASSAAAGDQLTVYARIRNVGGEPANDVKIGIMLSTNPVISPQDLELDSVDVSLMPGESVTSTTTLTIPGGTNAGTYYVGALADPLNEVDENDESNNGKAAFQPLTLTGGSLEILTQRLPAATARQAYLVPLRGAGGNASSYVWSISQGTLPANMGLSSGEIYGRPTVQECQNFTVELTDGNETASQDLMLCVVDPDEPLTIVNRAVPATVVGQEYEFALVAAGGTASSSLAWSAQGLPDGISISADGVLMGTATEPGTSTTTLMVTGGSESASRVVSFDVRENANMLIVPKILSTARFGQSYSEPLSVAGGLEPITWFLASTGRLPEGLSLSSSGVIEGVPMEVGTFSFIVEARDAAAGSAAARDANAFVLTVVDDEATFTITPEELPDGVIGQGYQVEITAMNGIPPYDWSISRLPDGLQAQQTDQDDLIIVGQPSVAGVTSLLVTVRDSQNRTAQRALALRVVEAPAIEVEVEDEGGCGCRAAGSPVPTWPLVSLLLGLLLIRRRRF